MGVREMVEIAEKAFAQTFAEPRVLKEWAPGDSEAYPTTEYSYAWFASAPYRTTVLHREEAGAADVREEHLLFDGLGRPGVRP